MYINPYVDIKHYVSLKTYWMLQIISIKTELLGDKIVGRRDTQESSGGCFNGS